MSEHPFIPGARVAIGERYGDGVTEAFVEKVYKSGNFTLRGSKQQWSPWQTSYGDKRWGAVETGSGYSRRRLDLWDDTTDQDIRARIEAEAVKQRWRKIVRKIDATKHPTSAMCDAIETALAGGEASGLPDDRSAVDQQPGGSVNQRISP